ncbi:Not1 N-terminal domain, CCR4-Not complex component-domain-containing protein [Flagelloscypha sp. PMI_526]|nr:Not1 N-terminal domain, CCR4-Not complex component-domain-containing protein [Flagelloscypha sp. PMI_526]
MAARKLQTEIDRTLKKVSEGVELFEGIYEKMQASTNQTQKEKLELDLKTQIKKLQRLRDQIKTWVASNDIKDKSSLLDNRRLIETQMEKFKACEKEMKTKAFSKEGLIQAARLDPKEQEKEDAVQWLQSQVEELQMQVESAEAEIETLQGASGKKRGKANSTQGRLEELDGLNERRKWHVNRLEIVLRLCQNGSISPERVMALKDDVQYFVESNTKEEDFEEDEGIYDELNLDEEEEKFNGPARADDDHDNLSDSDIDEPPVPPPPRSKKPSKHQDDDEPLAKPQDSPILKKAVTATRKQSVDTKLPPNINFAANPMSSVVSRNLGSSTAPAAPAPRVPAPLPPIKYAAAAAQAVSQPPPPPSAPATQTAQPALPPPPATAPEPIPASPSLTHPSTISPMLSSAASVSAVHQQTDGTGSMYSAQDSPAISNAEITDSPQRLPKVLHSRFSKHAILYSGSNFSPACANTGINFIWSHNTVTFAPANSSAAITSAAAQQPRQATGPSALQDLMTGFENVKKNAPNRLANTEQVHGYLNKGMENAPQPHEMERPKYYLPRHPFATPPYYPQSPHPLLNQAWVYSTFEVETLFFIFYYLPGTFSQHLAAKELKSQSWRFHTKYMTWFQRHSEPQAITDEYEQGVYIYFDWEGSWCQRKKSDFRFEYRYLSEE